MANELFDEDPAPATNGSRHDGIFAKNSVTKNASKKAMNLSSGHIDAEVLTDPFVKNAEAAFDAPPSEPSGAAPLMAVPASRCAINGAAAVPSMFAGEGLKFVRNQYSNAGDGIRDSVDWEVRGPSTMAAAISTDPREAAFDGAEPLVRCRASSRLHVDARAIPSPRRAPSTLLPLRL